MKTKTSKRTKGSAELELHQFYLILLNLIISRFMECSKISLNYICIYKKNKQNEQNKQKRVLVYC